jgi:hypothetical protein
MLHVFQDSLSDAIQNGVGSLFLVCLRELIGLPISILREFQHETLGKSTLMNSEGIPSSRATTGQVILGTLPFLLFGMILIMIELPVTFFQLEWFTKIGGHLLLAVLILPAIGFGIGWVQNFPRWSYPYTGMMFIMALYIRGASTPGVIFFGIPIFGRELWGWRAWLPMVTSLIAALAISRSLKPVIGFFKNLWKDWSIPSYFMVGALPLLVLIAFDEIDRMYSLYFMTAFALLLVGMVVFYLRSRYPWQRVLVLTAGICAILFPAALGSNSYWLGHNGTTLPGARSMLIMTGKIALIMLVPAWLELLRWLVRQLRTVW